MKKLSGFLMMLFVAGTLAACATQGGSGSTSGSGANSGEGMFNSSVRK